MWRHMLNGSPRGGAALQISPPFVSNRYNDLYKANRSPALIAAEAVRHIDELFEIERTVFVHEPRVRSYVLSPFLNLSVGSPRSVSNSTR
jgi:hypothetical protein